MRQAVQFLAKSQFSTALFRSLQKIKRQPTSKKKVQLLGHENCLAKGKNGFHLCILRKKIYRYYYKSLIISRGKTP